MRRLAPLLCLLALPASADPTPPQTARLSAQLYAVGVASGDPLLILAAARLRKSMGEPQQAALRWQDMLATAKPLAESDDSLSGLIRDLEAENMKGVASGPVYNIGALKPGEAGTFADYSFTAGAYAEVYAEAQGNADLNITVTDAAGALVCADTDPSPIAYCGWRPETGGSFTVTVENRGPDSATYALMSN